jgi:Ca2+-transporting ATPase
VQEAALTGEAEAVEKHPEPVADADASLGDRGNCLYMGTTVVHGRGLAVVTATGGATELGRIAAMLASVEREPTPLQRRLDHLGKTLAVLALALVALFIALGLLRGEEPRALLLTALGMAVAAVPEGLPAVVTIALALGTQRMLRRRAQVRKLPAVETLGSVTVVCADKTGTLTQNRMTVVALEVAGGHGVGAGPLLAAGVLCNDATCADGRLRGDPTETALVAAAAAHGLRKDAIEAAYPRVAEAPFDADRKRMTTVHAVNGAQGALPPTGGATHVAITKGAADSLVSLADRVWTGDGTEPLDAGWRDRIAAANERLAADGMRVLGVAYRPLALRPGGGALAAADLAARPEELERGLVFLGLVGIQDPPRPEAAAAVEECRTAGIRPVMITGDHPLTALAVARSLGLVAGDARVLTGPELARMGVAELEVVVDDVAVYARVAPEHKLKIVEALQRRGHVVAMTGDGVNDAPALKKADIGVAMGVTGTDVAKEAADMVLLDDNFATVVAAVEEGRSIYGNVRKFVRYLMATNAGELWLMLLAPFAGMPLPLLPLQILWVNLVTDGPAALALAVEPPEPGAMRRPPHRPTENILARGLGRHVLWVGLLMALLALGVGYGYWAAGRPEWQTMVFTVVVFAQMAHVLAIRSERESLFAIGLGSNRPLLAAVALTVALQLSLVYWPPARGLFDTVVLSGADLALATALSSVVFWAVELEKWLARRRRPRPDQPPQLGVGERGAVGGAVAEEAPERAGDDGGEQAR